MRPIVLIHGAWHGAWAFDSVTEGLARLGVDVHDVDLPLTGLEEDVAAARRLIVANPGAVVLGHSYGGLVITLAARGLDVSHLVYLAAMMPEQGEDVRATLEAGPATVLQRALRPLEDGRVIVTPDLAVEAFYDDCDPDEARDAVSRLRPMVMGSMVQDEEPAWKDTTCTYVVCRHDKALHPEVQERFAARADRRVDWDLAHSPFLADPGRVVDLLAELAEIPS